MIQKWIALFPNGQEAWTEWRRTGYPKLNVIKTLKGAVQGATLGGRYSPYDLSHQFFSD